MGKKKSDIYVCFQILPFKNKANKSIFQCKFCDRQYLQNATKMESHIITQCQKVPAAIRASYTTKPGNGGGGGSGSSSALSGLNLSLMNKHEDLDVNDLIRDYSDSSASDQPEHMVVNVSVPGMYRMSKNSSSAAGSSSGGGRGSSNNNHSSSVSQGNGGRSGSSQPPKNSPPTFSSLYNSSSSSPQNLVNEFNQRSMQIRAYSQLVSGINSMNHNSNSASSNNNSNGGNRKRPKLDNQANNNNNNNNASLNNNNYYTIGNAGTAHKILIKPSHGVPATKLPGLGASRINNGTNNGSNNNSILASATSATISSVGGTSIRKVKPPLIAAGATITKSVNMNNNLIAGYKEKLSREETVEIWRLLARAIYSSDVPLSILENEHWINVLHRIQPSLTLPSTSIVSNVLLDQEYARISQELEEKVEKSHFSVLECVTVPGSRTDEVTLVFYLNCDDSPNPFLYKTHRISTVDSTEDGGYTKDNLSKIIEDVMLDIGLNKVVAFMSDLTPEMEGTWEILRDKFPGLLTFGCVIYGLNSILDKILTLPEIVKMIDLIKKLYNKIEKSQELKKLVEDALGKKHVSPYDSEEDSVGSSTSPSIANNNNNNSSKLSGKRDASCLNGTGSNSSSSSNSSNCNSPNGALLTKWKLVGKLMSQLISEKAVYQQLLTNPDSKKVLDGMSSDSPNGKSDRSLSNHLSSESFWTSLQSLNSITVPCLQWIDSLKPDRECSLSEVPEVFKELKSILQSHLRNFPVDDLSKQSVQKHFLQVQRKCVNEIHFTASLLNPNQKLRGVLTEDEEAQGMEFLTYFCDSRGYHAGSILRELADYKSLSGVYGSEKVWKMGSTMEAAAWWRAVQGESALSNIAISLARVVPSCSIPEPNLIKPDFGGMLDEEKSEKLAFIQHNLQKPNKAKLPRTNICLKQPETIINIKKEKETPPPPPAVVVPVPAKIEKLRIKIPKKDESSESPAMDLSARLSGCSQVSDEEDDDDDDDSDDDDESNSNSAAKSSSNPSKPAKPSSPHSKPDGEDDDNSDDGSTKDADDSSSDSDDSSSDDQSD